MHSDLEHLAELFARFPGIGPRQAKRFAYFLAEKDKSFIQELTRSMLQVGRSGRMCSVCKMTFSATDTTTEVCSLCTKRIDATSLVIVEKTSDIEHLESLHLYKGRYFVLGGTIPITRRKYTKVLNIEPLKRLLQETGTVQEIIFALGATAEGDHTTRYVIEEIKPITEEKSIRVEMLGRGLSTGAEIEYADSETIKNAFDNIRSLI